MYIGVCYKRTKAISVCIIILTTLTTLFGLFLLFFGLETIKVYAIIYITFKFDDKC